MVTSVGGGEVRGLTGGHQWAQLWLFFANNCDFQILRNIMIYLSHSTYSPIKRILNIVMNQESSFCFILLTLYLQFLFRSKMKIVILSMYLTLRHLWVLAREAFDPEY